MSQFRFVVPSSGPLIDEPVCLSVVGGPPGRAVRITARSTDASGSVFSSWADFRVDDDGTVQPARQRPLAGTYRGVDPFGLWWSMHCDPERAFALGLEPVPTTVLAQYRGEVLAQVEIERLRVAPGVSVEHVREGGLVATLFRPKGWGLPGAVVLGGSEGGIGPAEELAALLASHGIATLALAYFGIYGLPAHLVEIPLEYVGAALDRLRAEPCVARGRVGVLGASRGAELALLLASRYERVGPVVAISGSSVVWPGLVPDASTVRSAWTHDGQGIPFAVPAVLSDLAPLSRSSLSPRNAFLHSPPDERGLLNAMIPVERIEGPMLFVSGGDDRLWPSQAFGELAMRRLAGSGRASRGIHLNYPRAGHGLGRVPGLPAGPTVALHPLNGAAFALGGTRAANARGGAHAWRTVVQLLSRNRARCPV